MWDCREYCTEYGDVSISITRAGQAGTVSWRFCERCKKTYVQSTGIQEVKKDLRKVKGENSLLAYRLDEYKISIKKRDTKPKQELLESHL